MSDKPTEKDLVEWLEDHLTSQNDEDLAYKLADVRNLIVSKTDRIAEQDAEIARLKAESDRLSESARHWRYEHMKATGRPANDR